MSPRIADGPHAKCKGIIRGNNKLIGSKGRGEHQIFQTFSPEAETRAVARLDMRDHSYSDALPMPSSI
jgi:hypothetical protein